MYCPNINDNNVLKDFNKIVKLAGGQSLSRAEFKDSNLRDARTGIDRKAMNLAFKYWDITQGEQELPNSKEQLEQFVLDSLNGNIQQETDIQYNDKGEILAPNGKVSKLFKNIEKLVEEQSKSNLDEKLTKQELLEKKQNAMAKYSKSPTTVSTEELKKGRLTMQEAVNAINNNLDKNSSLYKIFKLLQRFISLPNLPLIVRDVLHDKNAQGHRSYTFISLNQNTFNKLKAGDEMAIQTFIHELVHELTFEVLRNPITVIQKEAVKKLQKIYEQLVDEYGIDSAYGFTDLDEFLSEAFSNPVFQRYLTDKKGKGKTTTLFKDLLNTVLDLFHSAMVRWAKKFNKNIPNKDETGTLLQDVFGWAEDLVSNYEYKPKTTKEEIVSKNKNNIKQQALQLYKQTRTQEFKEWFGDSKLVDSNGEPLIVYHLTKEVFDTFDKSFLGKTTSAPDTQLGFFTTPYLKELQELLKEKEKITGNTGKFVWNNIMPLFLKANNPKIVNENISKKFRGISNNRFELIANFKKWKQTLLENNNDAIIGGALNGGKSYIVFEPNQIKSVFNQGEFSKKDDNILHSKEADLVMLPLTEESKPIYKHYNLLNDKGKVKYVPNNKTTEKWIKTLNDESPFYNFRIRRVPKGYKIFIVDPKVYKRAEGGIDPNIKEKYFKNNDTNNTKTVLEQISNSTYPLNRLATKLLDFVGNGIEIEYKDSQGHAFTNTRTGEESTAAGYYDGKLNKIVIYGKANFPKSQVEAAILHEIIHSMSHQALRNNNKATEEFIKLFEYTQKQFPKDTDYGLTDVDEFITELFTNSEFAKKLMVTPAKNKSKFSNILEELMDFFMKLFKINKNDSIYTEAVKIAGNIFLENKDIVDNYLVNNKDSFPTEVEDYSISEKLPTVSVSNKQVENYNNIKESNVFNYSNKVEDLKKKLDLQEDVKKKKLVEEINKRIVYFKRQDNKNNEEKRVRVSAAISQLTTQRDKILENEKGESIDKVAKYHLKVVEANFTDLADQLKEITTSEEAIDILQQLHDNSMFLNLWYDFSKKFPEADKNTIAYVIPKVAELKLQYEDLAKKGFIEIANRRSYRNDWSIEELFGDTEDISTITSNTFSVHRTKSEIVKVSTDLIEQAEFEAKNHLFAVKREYGILQQKALDTGLSKKELFDTMFQVDENGDKTGNIISEYKQSFWDKKRALMDDILSYQKQKGKQKETARAKAVYKQWIKENSLPRTVEYLNAIWNGEDTTSFGFGKKKDQEQKDKLNLFIKIRDRNRQTLAEENGYTNWEELLAEHKRLSGERQTSEVKSTLNFIEDILQEEHTWNEIHNPYRYLKNIEEGGKRKQGMEGWKYLISVVPNKKWRDPRFQKIENNKDLLTFYRFVADNFVNNVRKMPLNDKHLSPTFFPYLSTTSAEYIKEKGFLNYIKYRMPKEAIDNITGELQSRVDTTLHIEGQVLKNVPISMMEQTMEEDERSYDLERVFLAHTQMAANYEQMTNVKTIAEMSKQFLGEVNEVESYDNFGNLRIDPLGSINKTDQKLFNIRQQFDYYVDSILYGQRRNAAKNTVVKIFSKEDKKDIVKFNEKLKELYDVDLLDAKNPRESIKKTKQYFQKKKAEGNLSDDVLNEILSSLDQLGGTVTPESLMDQLIRFTYIKFLGFPNIVSPIINANFGTITNFNYAAGNQEFGFKEISESYKMVINASLRSKKGEVREDFKKIWLWGEKLNILGDITEGTSKGNWLDKLTILQEKGELLNQYPVMIAVMKKQKVKVKIKGKEQEIPIWDAYTINEKEQLVWNEAKYGKEQESNNIDIVNKDNGSGVNIKRLRDNIHATIDTIHGDYRNPIAIKRGMLGRVFSLFKTWLPNAIRYRFGNTEEDIRLGRNTKGIYRSVFAAETTSGELLNFKDMLGILRNFIIKSEQGYTWQDLSDTDKANLRRDLAELVSIGTLASIGLFLSVLGSDDDGEDNFADAILTLAGNVTSRTIADLAMFMNPKSSYKIMDNLVPIYQTVNDLASIMPITMDAMTGDFYYENGPWKDQLKIKKYFYINFPITQGGVKMYNYFNREYDFNR